MWSIPGAMIRDDESYDQDGTVKIRPSFRVFNQGDLKSEIRFVKTLV